MAGGFLMERSNMSLFLIILAALAVWTVVWLVSPITADSDRFQTVAHMVIAVPMLLLFAFSIYASFAY